jgi:NAD(P)H dehydrogenase (quinone)
MELTLNLSALRASTRRAGHTLLFLLGLLPPGPTAAQSVPTSRDRVVLVAFYSRTGNTEAMANAVAEGAREIPGVRVELKPISDVGAAELEGIDGLLVGSPTHWGNIPAEVATFIAEWPFLGGTVAGAFATAGNPGGGSENVLQSLISAFLNHGAMVVGPVFGEPGGRRFGWMGAAALTGPVGPGVNEVELDGARRLGRRVAEVVSGR